MRLAVVIVVWDGRDGRDVEERGELRTGSAESHVTDPYQDPFWRTHHMHGSLSLAPPSSFKSEVNLSMYMVVPQTIVGAVSLLDALAK